VKVYRSTCCAPRRSSVASLLRWLLQRQDQQCVVYVCAGWSLCIGAWRLYRLVKSTPTIERPSLVWSVVCVVGDGTVKRPVHQITGSSTLQYKRGDDERVSVARGPCTVIVACLFDWEFSLGSIFCVEYFACDHRVRILTQRLVCCWSVWRSLSTSLEIRSWSRL